MYFLLKFLVIKTLSPEPGHKTDPDTYLDSLETTLLCICPNGLNWWLFGTVIRIGTCLCSRTYKTVAIIVSYGEGTGNATKKQKTNTILVISYLYSESVYVAATVQRVPYHILQHAL
jgi:hypothetical protein